MVQEQFHSMFFRRNPKKAEKNYIFCIERIKIVFKKGKKIFTVSDFASKIR